MDKKLFQKNLQDQIVKTEKKIVGYEEMTQPVTPDSAIGRISRMDAIVNQSVIEAALREARHKLQLLRQMETLIDKPEFGLCTGCGQPIPEKRLLLMPESRQCVACAR